MSLLTLSPVENLVNTPEFPQPLSIANCGKYTLVGHNEKTHVVYLYKLYCGSPNCPRCGKRKLDLLEEKLSLRSYLRLSLTASTPQANSAMQSFLQSLRYRCHGNPLRYLLLTLNFQLGLTLFILYIQNVEDMPAADKVESLWHKFGGKDMSKYGIMSEFTNNTTFLDRVLRELIGEPGFHLGRMRSSHCFFDLPDKDRTHPDTVVTWSVSCASLQAMMISYGIAGNTIEKRSNQFYIAWLSPENLICRLRR